MADLVLGGPEARAQPADAQYDESEAEDSVRQGTSSGPWGFLVDLLLESRSMFRAYEEWRATQSPRQPLRRPRPLHRCRNLNMRGKTHQ